MDYAIEMIGITKDFPGIRANDHVDLRVKRQSIHALLGENGAGKSTLMSILFGLYQPTSGVIKVEGKEVVISDPNVATDLKIGMVHQHFKLVKGFSVTENIILGIEPKGRFGLLDLKKARKRVVEISTLYGLDVDPDAKIENITVSMQQRVEILKMLYRNADILIFDEPTAVLTPQEIEELMNIMRRLVGDGKTVVLITHKLKEIKAVADECTVLRRGKYIGTVQVKDTSIAQMAEMMVGREVSFSVDKTPAVPKQVVVEVKNLCVKAKNGVEKVKNVSLQVKAGEILGVAGIDNNGQTELVYAITGLNPDCTGEILLNGKDLRKLDIKQRFESGMGHIPEDRHRHGLILNFKLKENFIIHDYNTFPYAKNWILQEPAIDAHAMKMIEQFDVRSGEGIEALTASMSGGNQQKAILAREINRSPEFLVVVQPTRGLDVGAIEYIHKRIVEERDKGKAILLVSLELDEVLDVADRIVVMCNGEVTGEVMADATDENELGLMMSGHKRMGGQA